MAPWKQILLKAVGVGIGIGVGLAISVAFYAWYSSRPKPQKPWDANAITATFESADTMGADHHLRFLYSLENHTDIDYKIETPRVRSVQPTLRTLVGLRLLRYDLFLRKAGCGTQL